MNTPVISATGLWTPPNSISNEELVNSYNMWADIWNRERGADISAGVIEPKTHSSVEFIEKASGIKSRYVIDKTGILDPDIMAPRIAERPNDRISVLAEIAVHAARDALERSGRKAEDIDAVICAASLWVLEPDGADQLMGLIHEAWEQGVPVPWDNFEDIGSDSSSSSIISLSLRPSSRRLSSSARSNPNRSCRDLWISMK